MKKIFDEKLIDEISRIEVDLPADDWDLLAAKIPAKPVNRKFAWWYAVAASVAVLLVVGGIGLYYLGGGEEKPLIAQTEAIGSDINSIELSKEQQKHIKESIQNTTIINELSEDKKSLHNGVNIESINTNSDSKKASFTEKPELESVSSTDKESTKIQQTETHKESVNTIKSTEESLDDYADRLRKDKGIEKNQTPAQKKSGKEQRRELKQRMGFEKPLYARASASVAPAGVSTGKLSGQNLASTNPNIYFAQKSPTDSYSKHNMPMIVSLEVGIPIIERWLEIHTGVQYTYLHSKTETYAIGTNTMISKSIQGLHYVGVPINIASNFFEKGRFRLYAAGGVALDKGLLNRSKTIFYNDDLRERSSEQKDQEIRGLQVSLNASAGASVNIAKGLNFYLEPRLTWYIPNEKHPQPQSKITDTPILFNIVGGFRWNFSKNLK